jgi:hypothetical protein
MTKLLLLECNLISMIQTERKGKEQAVGARIPIKSCRPELEPRGLCVRPWQPLDVRLHKRSEEQVCEDRQRNVF